MNSTPRVLSIFNSYGPGSSGTKGTLDYHVYDQVPRPWRFIEKLLRLDFLLARRARAIADEYDVLFTYSEKVGIPLAWLGVSKPIVTVFHHSASPIKKHIVRLTGAHEKWAQVGYPCNADRDYLRDFYHLPEQRLFEYIVVRIDQYTPGVAPPDAPIMSVGASKRDYPTLIAALQELPGYQTMIFASSRFGDQVKRGASPSSPEWVRFMPSMPHLKIIEYYRRASFVVLPIEKTTQFSAGVTVALEAHASGKAIIATHTKGMTEFVVDGVTGILVPPGDVMAMRAAIHKLWQDPQLAQQMGAAGRQHVERNFDPDTLNMKFKKAIDEAFFESRI